ncbi:MAG: hypothetical protein WBD40_21980, partial [Tepidisphaeraceae bacterium]
MRGATWMLLGLGGVVTTAWGQNLSFTSVLDSDSSVPGAGTLSFVGQVVLQDDNAVASIVRFGPAGNSTNAVTFNPTPGNSAAAVVVKQQDAHAAFGVSGGGDFDEFHNLAAAGGNVTFAAVEETVTTGRGIMRYAHDATSPLRFAIHFDGDMISGSHAALYTDFGLPAYGVNSAGRLVYSPWTVAPSPLHTQFVARFDGTSSTRIHDASTGVGKFNLLDSYFLTRKSLTESGHAVFVGDAGDGRRIYDVAPNPSPMPSVRVEKSLEGGVYEPQQLLAATGDAAIGATLFRAFKDRTNPTNDDWKKGALLVQSPTGLRELGSFDLSPGSGVSGPEVTAEMSDNGRIAAFLPDANGGHVVYYDAAAGGIPLNIAAVGTNVVGGFSIAQVGRDGLSVPMVNENGTIVFDAVLTDGVDQRDALLAWTVGSDDPFVVVRVGDTISIDGNDETIFSLATIGPMALGELYYDADVRKDGLNDDDFLAFGVRYDDGASTAILLTQIPEPAGALVLLSLAGATLLRRTGGR